jgi:hypothetical protein
MAIYPMVLSHHRSNRAGKSEQESIPAIRETLARAPELDCFSTSIARLAFPLDYGFFDR